MTADEKVRPDATGVRSSTTMVSGCLLASRNARKNHVGLLKTVLVKYEKGVPLGRAVFLEFWFGLSAL